MHHLLRASTAKRERANDPLSLTKQALGNGRHRLVYSRYFEVAKLPDTKSTTVITYTKSTFARQEIPSEVISDNGPQYSTVC